MDGKETPTYISCVEPEEELVLIKDLNTGSESGSQRKKENVKEDSPNKEVTKENKIQDETFKDILPEMDQPKDTNQREANKEIKVVVNQQTESEENESQELRHNHQNESVSPNKKEMVGETTPEVILKETTESLGCDAKDTGGVEEVSVEPIQEKDHSKDSVLLVEDEGNKHVDLNLEESCHDGVEEPVVLSTANASNVHLKEEKVVICGECANGFKTIEAFERHKQTCHRIAGQSYDCIKCDFMSNSMSELFNHIAKTHKKDETQSCHKCELTMLRLADHNADILKQLNEVREDFKISLNQMQANNKSAFEEVLSQVQKIEIKGLGNEKPSIKKNSSNGENIKLGQISNLGARAREFNCNHCKYNGTSFQDLLKHMQVHTGLKTYFCKKCERTFKYRDSLQEHVQQVHKVLQVKCKLCNYESTSQEKVNIHMSINHFPLFTQKVDFKYSICFSESTTIEDLKKHILTEHVPSRKLNVSEPKPKMPSASSKPSSHENRKAILSEHFCQKCKLFFRTEEERYNHVENTMSLMQGLNAMTAMKDSIISLIIVNIVKSIVMLLRPDVNSVEDFFATRRIWKSTFRKFIRYYQQYRAVISVSLLLSSFLPSVSISNMHSLKPKLQSYVKDLQESSILVGLLCEIWKNPDDFELQVDIE